MRIASRVQVATLVSSILVCALSTAAWAWDPGFNQPGALGGRAGAPGPGAWDPGINQPGAIGNRPVPRGVWDPAINQPGRIGNVPAPRGVWDPGFNQPGRAGNVRRFYR
jgi:hypothetical protein